MKQCPHCKATIEENSRFCLYCMTSLEEKENVAPTFSSNKRWKYILSAAVVVGILLACVFCIPRCSTSSSVTPTTTLADKAEEAVNTSSNFLPQNNETTYHPPEENLISSQGTVVQNGSSSLPTANVSGSTSGANPSLIVSNNTGSSFPTVSSQGASTLPGSPSRVSSVVSPTPSQSSSQSTPPSVATYTYRAAKYGDDYAVSTDMSNRIVITGVKTISSNGVYTIPSTIDGKQVLSIMGNAFDGVNVRNTVKTVIVPSTVKTIWDNAFSACYNLSDIYLQGSSIFIDTYAFAPTTKRNCTLTIHCSANCNNRNFRYYKNIASDYGAIYKEWNG